MINLEEFLSKYYKKDEPIILACSTWADSMFLLYKILETSYRDNLVASYFNHKLRKQSDQEETWIEKMWKEKWFKVELAQANIKEIRDKFYPSKWIEEIAREKRYAFLNTLLNIYKTDKIITAHHLDDKIETFFFNLARGTKLTGLINMKEKSWAILRPLLGLEKSEILKYLEENKLKYNEDITNQDTEITRNFLRHEIIPKFEKINKNYKKNIENTLSYFEYIKKHLEKEVKDFLDDKNYFMQKDFQKKDDFMQKEIISYIYFISNWKSTIGLSRANISEIIKFIKWKNNKTIKEIKNLKMRKDNEKIYF